MDLKRRLAMRRAAEGTEVVVQVDEPPAPLVAAPSAPAAPEDASHQARVSRLRGMLDALITRQKARDAERLQTSAATALAEMGTPRLRFNRGELPGEERETPHGKIHVVSHMLEPHYCHGKVAVAEALRAKAEIVARIALDEGLGAIDLKRMLFLDTETTGLNGGTGTVPFLIGLAWFEDESMAIEQLLLKRPGDEAPMLAQLAERLKNASCLVTYNGKSYDWPLLSSRYVMSRLEVPEKKPHLDLLHCARRMFKRRLKEVRLVTIEHRLLGFRRERDIDGYEIPSLYWSVIRGAPPTMLTPILEHNANDVLALAAILAVLADRYERLHREDDPTDHLALAQVAARASDPDRALAFASAAADGGGDDQLTVEALSFKAKLASSRGDHEAARAALERALKTTSSTLLAAPVHLALSKLFEHRLRDVSRALEHARFTEPAEGEELHMKRVQRLEKRLKRGAE